MQHPPLLTLDESRAAFVASALEVLEATVSHPPRLIARYLAGRGAVARLPVQARVVVLEHRRLLDRILELGYGWALSDEIDGLHSLVLEPEWGPREAIEVVSSMIERGRLARGTAA